MVQFFNPPPSAFSGNLPVRTNPLARAIQFPAAIDRRARAMQELIASRNSAFASLPQDRQFASARNLVLGDPSVRNQAAGLRPTGPFNLLGKDNKPTGQIGFENEPFRHLVANTDSDDPGDDSGEEGALSRLFSTIFPKKQPGSSLSSPPPEPTPDIFEPDTPNIPIAPAVTLGVSGGDEISNLFAGTSLDIAEPTQAEIDELASRIPDRSDRLTEKFGPLDKQSRAAKQIRNNRVNQAARNRNVAGRLNKLIKALRDSGSDIQINKESIRKGAEARGITQKEFVKELLRSARKKGLI